MLSCGKKTNIFGRVAGKLLGGRKVALLGAVGDDAEGAQYRHDDGVGDDDTIMVCTVGLFLPQRR